MKLTHGSLGHDRSVYLLGIEQLQLVVIREECMKVLKVRGGSQFGFEGNGKYFWVCLT